MLRKKKNYVKPRQIYESERIKDENVLVKKYGLKNKREIWKMIAKITYFRRRAKELARAPLDEQEVFFNKLKALGLKIEGSADVLDLKVEDILERRLSTIVQKKNLASTAKEARQKIVHKKILVDGKVINAPSYIVPVSQENLISIKQKAKKPKAEKAAEQSEEMEEEVGDDE